MKTERIQDVTIVRIDKYAVVKTKETSWVSR